MWTKRATLKSDDKRGTGAASNIYPRVLGGRATERERAGEQRGKDSAEILFQAPKATPPNASIQS